MIPCSTFSPAPVQPKMKSRSVASWVALALLAMVAAAAVVQANELEMEVGANNMPVQRRRSDVPAHAS